MNKFGFNIQVPGAGFDLIERYRPEWSLLMDIKSEHVAQAHQLGTKVIFRKEDGQKWRDKEPVSWTQMMWADVHECPPELVVLDNEPLGHAASHEFAALDQWQRAAADWIHANTPMRVGMFSFPEGNFTREGPNIAECFPLSLAAADAVFVHEYWKPHLDSPGMEGYHCLRWAAWLKWFEDAGYPDMPIYVTECGITMAVGGGPDVGWASEEAKAAGVTSETYLADLKEYHRRCCEEPRIKTVLPFIFETYPGEWGTFVPTPSMTERIFTFDAPGPGPEPEPEPEPNGGNTVKIYDFDHGPGDPETRDWDWLVSVFGDVQIRPITRQVTPSPGDIVYVIDYLDARVGDANIIINVRDLDGNPVVGETVIFGWPGAEPHDMSGKPSNWTTNGVSGDTNANGDVGPGMGTGAYYSPDDGERGPHFVWVWDRPSEYIDGLGMLPGGYPWQPHAHINIGYKAIVWGEGPEPEPEPGPEPIPPEGVVSILYGIADDLEDHAVDLRAIADGLIQAQQLAADLNKIFSGK